MSMDPSTKQERVEEPHQSDYDNEHEAKKRKVDSNFTEPEQENLPVSGSEPSEANQISLKPFQEEFVTQVSQNIEFCQEELLAATTSFMQNMDSAQQNMMNSMNTVFQNNAASIQSQLEKLITQYSDNYLLEQRLQKLKQLTGSLNQNLN